MSVAHWGVRVPAASPPWSGSSLKARALPTLFTAVAPAPGPGLPLSSGAQQNLLAGRQLVNTCGLHAVPLEAGFTVQHVLSELHSHSILELTTWECCSCPPWGGDCAV